MPAVQPCSLSYVFTLELGREVGITALQTRGTLVECLADEPSSVCT